MNVYKTLSLLDDSIEGLFEILRESEALNDAEFNALIHAIDSINDISNSVWRRKLRKASHTA